MRNVTKFLGILADRSGQYCALTKADIVKVLEGDERAWAKVLKVIKVNRNKLGANATKEYEVRSYIFAKNFYCFYHSGKSESC